MIQQKTMKEYLTTVRSDQEKMRQQLEVIRNLLEERGPSDSTILAAQ